MAALEVLAGITTVGDMVAAFRDEGHCRRPAGAMIWPRGEVVNPLWSRTAPALQLPTVFKSAVGRQLRRTSPAAFTSNAPFLCLVGPTIHATSAIVSPYSATVPHAACPKTLAAWRSSTSSCTTPNVSWGVVPPVVSSLQRPCRRPTATRHSWPSNAASCVPRQSCRGSPSSRRQHSHRVSLHPYTNRVRLRSYAQASRRSLDAAGNRHGRRS
jgi:hypothetical protein